MKKSTENYGRIQKSCETVCAFVWCFSTLDLSDYRILRELYVNYSAVSHVCTAFSTSVLLNLFRFHSPLPSIAAFSFTLLWIYDWCDNNHNTSSCSLLDHSICCTLSTACFPPCNKLATIFKYGLITDSASQNVFFRYISSCAIWRGNKGIFTSRVIYGWWMEGISLFAEIFVLLLEKLRGVLITPRLVCKWLQHGMNQNWFLYLKYQNMHWADGSWLASLLLGWNSPYRYLT